LRKTPREPEREFESRIDERKPLAKGDFGKVIQGKWNNL